MLPPELNQKYEVRGTLGAGAMGTVYDAVDRIIERRVAIKVVNRPSENDPEAVEAHARFRREAQAAGRLSHPNIVGVYDYGENATQAWIVMELVEGGSLKGRLDRHERFTIPEIVRIMSEVCAALQYSHQRGVVHRDIKPGNIMLTTDGQVKIADFGIARLENSSMTQVGTLIGTPSYMAPEQFRGEPVDLRADIWAAGVMLYQLLTGEKPFEGGFSAVMHKALHTEPPPPSQLSVTTPRGFDAVIARALAKRPEDRFASAAEFAEAIRNAAAGQPAPTAGLPGLPGLNEDATIVAGRPPAGGTMQQPPPGGRPGTGAPPPAGRGAPVALIAGGAAALIVALVAGWYFVMGPGAGPDPAIAERGRQERLAREAADQARQAQLAQEAAVREAAERERAAAAAQLQRQAEAQAQAARDAAERERAAAEAQRLAEAQARAAQERAAAEQAARLAAEREAAARDQAAREQAQRERLAAEQAAREAAERDRIAREQQARQQAEREQAERERLAREAAERERLAREAAERDRLAHEQAARQEADRLAREQAERERLAREEAARQQAERDRIAREEAARQQAERDRIARLDLRAAAQAIAFSTPCSLIAWSATDRTLTLTGVVRRSDEPSVRAALAQRGVPEDAARLSLTPFDGAFCEALDLLRPFLGPPGAPPSVSVVGRLPLQKDELMRLDVVMPDWPAHLYVAYFMHSGEVANLVPSALQQAGAQIRLGEPQGTFPGWIVDEPYGTDLAVVIASDRPLFGATRPVVERQADYVAALAAALRNARATGTRVIIRPVVVETVARR
jgi:serine/threonine-protein kinase